MRAFVLCIICAIMFFAFYNLSENGANNSAEVSDEYSLKREQQLAGKLKNIVRNEEFDVELKESKFVGSTARGDQMVNYILNSTALQKTDIGTYLLEGVKGKVDVEENITLQLQSNNAHVTQDNDLLQLYNDVNIDTENYSLHTEELVVDLQQMKLKAPTAITARSQGITIDSKSAYSTPNAEVITFEGDAHLTIDLSVEPK